MKKTKKGMHFTNRILAILLCSLILLTMLFSLGLPPFVLSASASGIDNITARADYLYSTTWKVKKTVKGWKNNYTFSEGEIRHIPYGQPVTSGKYIMWGASLDTFLSAADDSSSIFYTQRSYYNGNSGSYSTYYAMDCSAFASYCWDLSSRTTTSSWNNLDVTSYGLCTSANVNKIQVGDALNLSGSHVVIISRITNGTYEVTEQTPPEIKRSEYTSTQLINKYSKYTIYRYNKRDSVSLPPSSHTVDPSYGTNISVTAPDKIKVYDGNHNELSKHWIAAGDVCTIHEVYTDGCCKVTYPTSNGNVTYYSKIEYFNVVPNPGPSPRPTVEGAYIGQVTSETFRPCLILGDDASIDHVSVAIWTDFDQDDLQWYDCLNNGSNTFYNDIRFSDFDEGAHFYICHFYVYLPDGTRFFADSSTYEVILPGSSPHPTVNGSYFGQTTSETFRPCLMLEDDAPFDHVSVAIWTDFDQDDLQWYDCLNNGSNTFYNDIRFSDFNEGVHFYICHFYVNLPDSTRFLADTITYELKNRQ